MARRMEWLQDRDNALKDQFVVDGEVMGSVTGPYDIGQGRREYTWQFKNWVPTKGHVSGRNKTRDAAKNALKKVYRLWLKGRQPNPRGGRTMKRSANPRSKDGHKWGVYCRGTLAYVSSSKPDTTRAKTKLKRAGFGVCTVKKVLPNPVSGKIPVVGWRESFKKASRVQSAKRRNPFLLTGGGAGTKRSWIPPRTKMKRPSSPPPAGRQRIVKGRRNPTGVIRPQHVGKAFSSLPGVRGSDASRFGRVLAIDVGKRYYVRDGIFQIENNEQRDQRLKRNPDRGVSARATAGRMGRQLSRYSPAQGWAGRDRGIGTRSVASGGRLRNPSYEALSNVAYKAGFKVGKRGGKKESPSQSEISTAIRREFGMTPRNLVPDMRRELERSYLANWRVGAADGLLEIGGTAYKYGSKVPRPNPRRRNAASILRRRTNPTDYTVGEHKFKSLPAARKAAKEYSLAYTSASVVQEIRDSSGRVVRRNLMGRYRHGKPYSTSRSANPRKGYVVQVGNSIAWVGKLSADAQKVMRKLIAAGHKSVKGFQAKLLGAKMGWRKQYRRASNPAFGKGKLGSGSRFKSCVKRMSRRKGVTSPQGLCASIGRRKYGGKRMAGMARKGRRSNPLSAGRYILQFGGAFSPFATAATVKRAIQRAKSELRKPTRIGKALTSVSITDRTTGRQIYKVTKD